MTVMDQKSRTKFFNVLTMKIWSVAHVLTVRVTGKCFSISQKQTKTSLHNNHE